MKSNNGWKLHTYLYLVVVAVLLPAVLLMAWNGYSRFCEAEDAAAKQAYHLAQITADNTQAFVADAQLLLKTIVARVESRRGQSNDCDPIFAEFKDLFPSFANLSQSTPDGYIICSSVPLPNNKKRFIGDTQWFKLVYEQNKFIIAPPYKGKVTGRMVSVMAYPLRNNAGEIVGALQLPIDLVSFKILPGKEKLPQTINISLLEPSGTVVARSQAPEQFIGKNLSNVAAVKHILTEKDGTHRALSSQGIDRIYGFRRVPGTDWIAVVGIAASEALYASRIAARNNIITGTVVLVFATFVAFLASKKISRPILLMQATAAQVATGEYERRASVSGPKEIRAVSEQFNAMLDAIEHSQTIQAARESEVYKLAFYDLLTSLPNRRLLLDRLAELSKAANHAAQIGAVFYIDLDRFKNINDAHGHRAGDLFLKEVAERLDGARRHGDVLARIGGDEFVYIAMALGRTQEAAAAAALSFGQLLQSVLQQRVSGDGRRGDMAASIGITLFPKLGDTSEILLHEADIAMYRVKQTGRNDIALFELSMRQDLTERLALEVDLQQAVEAEQLELYVQSQVDRNGKVTGAEGLLRWNHAVRGPVSPAEFIPIAEQSNLIVQLGRWVLIEGCRAQVAAQNVYPGVPMSINVSPRQFRHPAFVENVKDAIRQSSADPALLILEVTEGLLIDDVGATIERMNELAEIGIRFSIDDFGTGYSSLAYLKRLPLYELKIDKSFIRDTPGDADDTAIVQSILGMAKHLGLHVVAEGVETLDQAEFLAKSGCNSMQGYLFARPKPLADWLKRSDLLHAGLR